MLTFNRLIIAVGYAGLSLVLAYALHKDWMRPSRRSFALAGLSITVFWTLYYGMTGLVHLSEDVRIAIVQFGHLLQLSFVITTFIRIVRRKT